MGSFTACFHHFNNAGEPGIPFRGYLHIHRMLRIRIDITHFPEVLRHKADAASRHISLPGHVVSHPDVPAPHEKAIGIEHANDGISPHASEPGGDIEHQLVHGVAIGRVNAPDHGTAVALHHRRKDIVAVRRDEPVHVFPQHLGRCRNAGAHARARRGILHPAAQAGIVLDDISLVIRHAVKGAIVPVSVLDGISHHQRKHIPAGAIHYIAVGAFRKPSIRAVLVRQVPQTLFGGLPNGFISLQLLHASGIVLQRGNGK